MPRRPEGRDDATIALVLGGTRSGKSMVAERLAGSFGEPVTYVATAIVVAGDADHLERIDRHRARRPTTWTTLECPQPGDLPVHLAATQGPVLVDSLGTWLVAHADAPAGIDDLVAALTDRTGPSVVVSEEVGMAVHPPTEAGRHFTDALGELNQAVAAIADRVLLVVAGRAIELPAGLPGSP